jgi:endoglucanase
MLARFRPLSCLLLLLLSTATGPATAAPPRDAFEANRRLGRGINLGNAFEAPRGADWGMAVEPGFFPIIKAAGFDSVRLPVRWNAYAAKEAPYAIEPEFAAKVDAAVDGALAAGLNVVLNIHHYDELYEDPAGHRDRFVGLWTQIAERYKDRSPALYFELLNEPHAKLDDAKWNDLIPPALGAVRASNPDRYVIVGPASWNSHKNLPKLRLPESDRKIIVTFHYYLPFPFTHQDASWVDGSAKWRGTRWAGSAEEVKALHAGFDAAAEWGKDHGRPLYAGEFGAYSRADMASRATWTAAVARAAEARKMSWAYWEFASGFGAYDREAKAWRAPLKDALVPAGSGRGE